MRLRSRELFQAVRSEGGLLPGDVLQRVADADPTLDGLTAESYGLDPGERLNERITRAWNRLGATWRAFDEARAALPPGEAGGALTRDRWLRVVFDELGYGRVVQQPAVEIDGRRYPVFSQWQHTPLHLVGCGVSIDRRAPGVAGAAGQSPHSLLQELLNRSPERLWGIVSNGLVLRVLRDNVALTRQAFVEFDLEAMFAGELYADFVLFWLVCHQSRVEADRPEDCRLERWSREAAQTGTRALESLHQGVERAIEVLGGGFLAQPANAELRSALRDGTVGSQDYYRCLLRLVYRLLFLFVAEDRDVLLQPEADPVARSRYEAHYSARRLRRLAGRRRGGLQHDLYEQLKLVTGALHEDGIPALGVPALGSFLWSPDAIGLLGDARMANQDLLAALRELAYVEEHGVRRAVDFRNLGAEELGSVYEALLELHPHVDRESATFVLAEVAGSERKTTGSYYTPTSLISALLDSALDPVLEEAVRASDPEAAILRLTVCDPACGSGHFLIAAANRMAKRLAAVRTGDDEPAPEALRAALRDVIARCVYGVDINPMAVELCKVSLWLETLDPGRPLSFLDDRIVRGNSLLGTTPELIAEGIPADAFKPILGDAKTTASELRKRNARERGGQLALDVTGSALDADAATLAQAASAIAAVDDGSLEGVHEREQRYSALLESEALERARLLADTWCAAFVAPKRSGEPALTEDALSRVARGGAGGLSGDELALVERLRARYGFHHLHVAFPAVAQAGGFDVVLGNPPWEHTELKEKEFFATRDPEIATAPTKASRERLINALEEEDPSLWRAFQDAKREADGWSHLLRNSGRYPLCGRGRTNTYAVFAELMRNMIAPSGRAGIIVPTGIATDDTTKHFFADLMASRSLASLFSFWEVRRMFPGTDQRQSFCLLTLVGRSVAETDAQFVFDARTVTELSDGGRRFTLTAEDIALLNPNTRTCPIFRSGRDAELTKAIYRRVPVLVREGDRDGNPWGVSFKQGLFNMSSDSHLFRTRAQLEADGWTLGGNVFERSGERCLPLYEAKMLHHFDHRWATYDGTDTRDVSVDEKRDPRFTVLPRYWVDEQHVDEKLHDWKHDWLLGWRDIARSTDERTVIAGFVPRSAVGHTMPIFFGSGMTVEHATFLASLLSSMVFDYTSRQKIGGTHVTYGFMHQLPVLPPDLADESFVRPRVLELAYTAEDLAGYARGLGYDGPPFRWHPDRRALIWAELDAKFFHLYGLSREDTDYVLDTFWVVRRRDEQAYGEYRTKRLILERYDVMAAAEAAGTEYVTPLDPPPGDPRAAHQPVEAA